MNSGEFLATLTECMHTQAQAELKHLYANKTEKENRTKEPKEEVRLNKAR